MSGITFVVVISSRANNLYLLLQLKKLNEKTENYKEIIKIKDNLWRLTCKEFPPIPRPKVVRYQDIKVPMPVSEISNIIRMYKEPSYFIEGCDGDIINPNNLRCWAIKHRDAEFYVCEYGGMLGLLTCIARTKITGDFTFPITSYTDYACVLPLAAALCTRLFLTVINGKKYAVGINLKIFKEEIFNYCLSYIDYNGNCREIVYDFNPNPLMLLHSEQ